MARIGYLRFSTEDQNGEAQEGALTRAGCERIFRDEAISGKLGEDERQGLSDCLEYLRGGDTLVAVKLDRLGRDALNLIALEKTLRERGIALECLDTGVIDATTATGELLFIIRCALTQWERRTIVERTMAGLDVARVKHGRLGPPPKLTDAQALEALARVGSGEAIATVAAAYEVSAATIHRARQRLAELTEGAPA